MKRVMINVHDGTPIRPSVKLEPGTLLPGEVMEVTDAQARWGTSQGILVEAPKAAYSPCKPKPKPKPKPKARGTVTLANTMATREDEAHEFLE